METMWKRQFSEVSSDALSVHIVRERRVQGDLRDTRLLAWHHAAPGVEKGHAWHRPLPCLTSVD